MCKIVFLLVSYNLVLPDVLVVVCWTESQDKLAKGHFSGCNSLWVRALLWSVLLSLSLRCLLHFRAL